MMRKRRERAAGMRVEGEGLRREERLSNSVNIIF